MVLLSLPVYCDGYKIPLIIGGDFNSTPDSGVHEYSSTGSVPLSPHHPLERVTLWGLADGLDLRCGRDHETDV